MTKTENQKKLLKILNEIFQLDQSDLDFGIYRIMNTKSKEINEFLDNDLLSSVKKAFNSNGNNTIQNELDEAIKQAQSLGIDADTIPKVQELKNQLTTTTTSSNLENDVFSHLATFFKRYYKDGDFVSLRRYKKDTYAIPYEGEEVKLHWANSDQYYIKSGEYFRDYSFVVNEKTIHFKLSDAQTESNNNKARSDKERRFVILDSNPCEVINDELYINFEYKAIGKENQDKLNESAIAKAFDKLLTPKLDLGSKEFLEALNTLAPTEKNKNRTIFEKHLKSYTSRNSFDYFIHKDLGGFLGRELDFYIKNEMLFLDDILHSPIKYEEVMGKVKIFKTVSQKIIAFLTQLEELQKRLWEKKKFVIETNYCITLDKINEKYYEEIFACKEQLAEWKTFFDVDIQSVDDLKEEKYLVLDTKFFDMKFKYKLLSLFDNLDDTIDGVLINSENFGALNLLQERYKEQVKTVYIDPPYNTGNDGFLYNDSYQHSSWMSFMNDRLALGRELMSDDGVQFNSIDDNEISNFNNLLESVFGKNNFIAQTVRASNSSKNNSNYLSITHDYATVYAKSKEYTKKNWQTEKRNVKDFQKIANRMLKQKLPLSEIEDELKSLVKYPKFYDFDHYYYCDEKGVYRTDNAGGVDSGNYKTEIYHPTTNKKCKKPVKGWRYNEKTITIMLDDNMFYFGKDENTIPLPKRYLEDYLTTVPSGISFFDTQIDSNFFKAIQIPFSFPKPYEYMIYLLTMENLGNKIILDYFAGSGTTGHAVINLNREDNGKRKYVLVEMGEYFETVTKPRIQKVIYSDSWKDGKPQTKNGISQIFKYFKLESYEDTLNNLEFKRTKEQQQTLDFHPEAKEDYILNYSLDVESQGSLLNIDTFKTPFDYKLKIATSSVGETKDTTIDLVETFNYLLGLVVKRIELLKGYMIIEGVRGHSSAMSPEKILIIWRDGQSSDELNEFFAKMDWSVYDREFDTIYVNGDNNLNNLRVDEDHYKVKLIEEEFKRLMFGE